MKILRYVLLALTVAFATGGAYAQRRSSRLMRYRQSVCSESDTINYKVINNYTDSLNALTARLSRQYRRTSEPEVNPYLYRLFGPVTYYSDVIHRTYTMSDTLTSSNSPTSSPMLAYRDQVNQLVDRSLCSIYTLKPQSVIYYDALYQNENLINVQGGTSREQAERELKDALNDVPGIDDIGGMSNDIEVGLQVVKPNFWKKAGTFSLQFTQNYFSENWYKGGNNNETMLGGLTLEANYNDQRKVNWENRLDMKLGFMTTTSDSCHHFLTNNDRIDLTSKLGIKATKINWYYTASFQAVTQFLPGYKSNDVKVYSNFLAPLDVYCSIGMDFKPTFKNKNTFSLALLPLSYKLRYIGTSDENVHRVYNIKNHNTREDFGSKVEMKTKINIAKNFVWNCRFYFFTSYKYAESELENTLTFAFSRYISADVYSLWRFDDSRSRAYYDRNLGYFQFKEYLTLGLKYAF